MEAGHDRLTAPPRLAISAGVVLAVAAAMLWLTWRTWPDVLIDSGRELYAAWRVSEGQLVARDIAWLSGPLSVGVNGLWFRLVGPGITSLAILNACLFGAVLTLVYGIAVKIGGRFGATVATVTIVVLSGFGQLTDVGNYNFITPYSHELTHGILLSFATLAAFSRFLTGRRERWLGTVGFLLGLVFLTKAEVFAATGAAVGAGLVAAVWCDRVPHRQRVRATGVVLVWVLIPVMLCFTSLLGFMPAREAFVATTGAWQHALDHGLVTQVFYRRMLGVVDPWRGVWMMAAGTVAYAAIAGFSLVAGRVISRWTTEPALSGRAGFVVGAAVFGLAAPAIPWEQAARPFPVLMVALAIAWTMQAARERARTPSPTLLALVLSVFAVVLLSRMALNAVVFRYGFALALPSVVVLIVALFEWIPAMGATRASQPHAVRGVLLAAWCVFIAVHLGAMTRQLDRKHVDVAAGTADAIRADDRGIVVNEALSAIANRLRPSDTLVVLPEGVMLNYLSRHINPTRFVTFMPPEVIAFGEDAMVADLSRHPPDYVALVDKDTSEYGLPMFGRDYGARLLAWVRAHYTTAETFGAPPLVDGRFGIQLLRRVTPR